MELDSAIADKHEPEAVIAARERVLRLLGMSQRPLLWAELQSALGLIAHEMRFACEWLTDHGYITPTSLVRGAARSAEALWSLAEKGRNWAKLHGALAAEGA